MHSLRVKQRLAATPCRLALKSLSALFADVFALFWDDSLTAENPVLLPPGTRSRGGHISVICPDFKGFSEIVIAVMTY